MPTTRHQLRVFGHGIDSFNRRNRCLLMHGKWKTYREWLSSQHNSLPENQPLVVFDFADSHIDGPQERRFYCLFVCLFILCERGFTL